MPLDGACRSRDGLRVEAGKDIPCAFPAKMLQKMGEMGNKMDKIVDKIVDTMM